MVPLQHGQRTERQTSDDRQRERERDGGGVHTKQVEAWQLRGRKARAGPQGEGGQAQAGNAAKQTEQKTLDQHFARQATATSADRGAHGEFLRTPFGPHEQQVGYVRARNQQDNADRRHHHPQTLAGISDEIVHERAHLGRKACVLHHLEAHPLGGGNLPKATRIMRATSAFTPAMSTPGRIRPTAWKL